MFLTVTRHVEYFDRPGVEWAQSVTRSGCAEREPLAARVGDESCVGLREVDKARPGREQASLLARRGDTTVSITATPVTAAVSEGELVEVTSEMLRLAVEAI